MTEFKWHMCSKSNRQHQLKRVGQDLRKELNNDKNCQKTKQQEHQKKRAFWRSAAAAADATAAGAAHDAVVLVLCRF